MAMIHHPNQLNLNFHEISGEKPGEVILRKLFHEFTILTVKKIDAILASEPLEGPLARCLQRGEDPIFDQLLTAFGTVAEHCLPSMLRLLFEWYQRQMSITGQFSEENQRIIKSTTEAQFSTGTKFGSLTKSNIQSLDNTDIEIYYMLEKRDLAVEFIFCLVLIEVLKQLPLHPGYDDLTNHIETLAFKHFKFREDAQSNPNLTNINMIADLYAEVIGVLAHSRFQSVRKRFMNELKELRSREPGPITTHNIISLLMGMKFFRIKMVPIEEFEASFQFMHECALYFQDLKDKDIKHALAGLFVEILVPVAATVKNEVNVPCLKNFVELLYSPCLDLCTKKKHCLALFPLVTCLLCVSQKSFFLSNWHYFLAMCLSHLKNRDSKMSRVALESLYRLLWVYMIRIKCESNTATQSRLHSIVNSLFPKGSKGVVPRDTPLNIFVKIIQFIAQERLDFAMKEIVLDLLSVGRPINKMVLTPERMSIGLRSFLVVADSLQQKDGEPPMPRTLGVLPSGNTLRVKKTFLSKMLTDEMAKNIGMNSYYPHVRKTLGEILRALDTQFGRPLMMTNIPGVKETDDMLSGERKPKIDLFRTCVAAIPRLIPEGIPRSDLIDLLARLTINIDDEMGVLAFQALQNLVVDFADWREDVIEGFVNFILHEINDVAHDLLQSALKMLFQLLTSWKGAVQAAQQQHRGDTLAGNEIKLLASQPAPKRIAQVLYNVEALALVMLCYCRQPNRRVASYILKEVRIISNLHMLSSKNFDEPVATILDVHCPLIIENCFPYISSNERATIVAMSYQVDLQWLAERSNNSWISDRGSNESLKSSTNLTTVTAANSTSPVAGTQSSAVSMGSDFSTLVDDTNAELKLNAWNVCLMSLMAEVVKHCPNAVANAWPIVCSRSNSLFTSQIDPNPVNDNRASSLLRPASNMKRSISSQERNFYLELWKSYLMFANSIAPSLAVPNPWSVADGSASPDSALSEKLASIEGSRSPISHSSSSNRNSCITAGSLFKQIIPLLRSEQCDLRNAVVLGLSRVNQYALVDLLDELLPHFREAIDRKQENLRRRKRREMLRIQIGRLLKLISERKIFAQCPILLNDNGSLTGMLIEYIDGVRVFFDTDTDSRESGINDTKESFCHFIINLIQSFPIETRHSKLSNELRQNLFVLFANWAGKYGAMMMMARTHYHHRGQHVQQQQKPLDFSQMTELEFLALKSMATVLCAGPMFDREIYLEGPNLYQWLENLLNADQKRINDIGLETLVLLLENNTEAGALLEWLIECCYTKPGKIADVCFQAIATIFSIREYPCDRYIAIIIVTMINVACPRVEIQQLALQLLQILDNRFFFTSTFSKDYNSRLLQEHQKPETDLRQQPANSSASMKDFEPLLLDLYRYSLANISQRMAMLHPQLTMVVFSEITYRFQTGRPTVCENLLQFLIPWLYNMQLVDTTTFSSQQQHQHQDYSYHRQYESTQCQQQNGYGWGSIESTQMVLNNLLYITIKFGDDYPRELELVWAALCHNRPGNLKIIFRYLFILTGLSPNEILPHAKKIAIYLARAQPERVIDELMTDLQAVELFNFTAERTEAFPYFRIVNRKCSTTHLDDDDYTGSRDHVVHRRQPANSAGNHSATATESKQPDIATTSTSHHSNVSAPVTELGTLHTKRHSKDLHTKYDDGGQNYRNYDSFNESGSSDDFNGSMELPNDDSLPMSDTGDRYTSAKPSTPQPRPLPMPEYGGYYAPLKEFLCGKDSTPAAMAAAAAAGQPGLHRCFLSLMLLCDVVIQDIHVDWTPHIPFMLHIIFLGMDHSRQIVYEHCKQLLLNLLVTCCRHQDNLTVARILLKNRIQQQNFGLSIPSIFDFNLPQAETESNKKNTTGSELDLDNIFTKSSENLVSTTTSNTTASTAVTPSSVPGTNSVHLNEIELDLNEKEEEEQEDELSENGDEGDDDNGKKPQQRPQKFSLEMYIKTLIDFISSKRGGPLWNSEDITSKVWTIRSAEQMSTFVEHVLGVFKESLPLAKIENRWADGALLQALQCSSRHYAGRSLQIFRALKIPMTRTMLSDILSRLVETVSEQGEDMQGYVTELMLTLESAIDTLDFKPRSILELINQYFHFDTTEDEDEDDDDDDDQKQQEGEEQVEDGDLDARTYVVDDGARPESREQAKINGADLYPTESSTTLVPAAGGMSIPLKHLKTPTRSTSYSMSFPMRRFNFLDERSGQRFCTRNDVDFFYNHHDSKGNSLANVSLGRSQSAQSLKNVPGTEENGGDDNQSTYSLDDKNSMLAQFFCIAVILLETEYEHEFLLALRLLEKCLQKMTLDDPDCEEKIEKIFVHIKWPNYPGLHQLLLKGLTLPLSYDPTINLLHKLTPYLKISVVDPTKSETSFPFHVMAMLPYLSHNYYEPNELCIQTAISIARWCNEFSNHNLENLATVMTLYSKRCFSKENSQWIKCVVKYLHDAYPDSFVAIISFLVEVAEKGPGIYLGHILSILHFMFNYIDLNTLPRTINEVLMKVSTKYIEGPQWKEALKMLKLVVFRSSILATPSYPPTVASTYASSIISSIYSDGLSISSTPSFPDSEFGGGSRRELPGRTMDFTFEIQQAPIVGAKLIAKRQALSVETAKKLNVVKESIGSDSAISSIHNSMTSDHSSHQEQHHRGENSGEFTLDKLFDMLNDEDGSAVGNANAVNRNDLPLQNSADGATLKRSNVVATQTRIRERLVNLFNRCGKRIVGLPKSPSVIFSQNSDVIENPHRSSMASSTDDMSGTNNDASGGDSKNEAINVHGEFACFREFDFLEYELESQEGESLDNFNWGVRRKSLSSLDHRQDEKLATGSGVAAGSSGKMREQQNTNLAMSDNQDEVASVTSEPPSSITCVSPIKMRMMMKVDQDESSDDEAESVSPLYNNHHNQIPMVYTSTAAVPVPAENSPLAQSRPGSLVSHGSSHSLVSEPELSLSNPISSNNQSVIVVSHPVESVLQPPPVPLMPPPQDDDDQHFMELINDRSGKMLSSSNPRLVTILKRTFEQVVNLTRESCDILSKTQHDQYNSMANRFLDLLPLISHQMEFPFVYLDSELYRTVENLLEENRFVVMELNTHWETFQEKRDALERFVQQHQTMVEISKLCKHLHKMHFQLFLLFNCYCKFVDLIKITAKHPNVNDRTEEIVQLRKDLIDSAVADRRKNPEENAILSNGGGASGSWFDPIELNGQQELELKDLIQRKEYSKATQLVQENLGDLNQEWLDWISSWYCRTMFKSETEQSSPSVVITEPQYHLAEIVRQLMDTFVIYNSNI